MIQQGEANLRTQICLAGESLFLCRGIPYKGEPDPARAIKAILETGTSITDVQKQAIQRACEGEDPAAPFYAAPHFGIPFDLVGACSIFVEYIVEWPWLPGNLPEKYVEWGIDFRAQLLYIVRQ